MSKPNKIIQFIAKWAIVGVGVTLTIVSAIISNYFIAKNNDYVNDLEFDARNIAQQIEEIWENSRSLEIRKNTAVTLIVHDADHTQTREFVYDTFALLGSPDEQEISYFALEEAFQLYKESVIEQINDKYLVQQNFIDQVQITRMDNDLLINIALCFQILGLILVLSRGIL